MLHTNASLLVLYLNKMNCLCIISNSAPGLNFINPPNDSIKSLGALIYGREELPSLQLCAFFAVPDCLLLGSVHSSQTTSLASCVLQH